MNIYIELLGYAASVLVALSLTMSNVWRLRWINLGGAVTFVIYAWLIASWPVLAVNAWITGVNVFYLRRMARARDAFDAFHRPSDDPILQRFVESYADDIATFFPDFDRERDLQRECLLILRNLAPVGLVIYERTDEVIDIRVDYVTPAYRDFQNGHFLYDAETSFFRDHGARHLRARSEVPQHQRYLREMGFQADPSDPTTFVKQLGSETA